MLSRIFAAYDLNLIFKMQDQRMLRSQQLDDPGDISHYHLFGADRALALYFGMRKHAFELAGQSPYEHEHHRLATAGG